jgi:hypothetical protein
VVEDDAPEGFYDLTHAYTMFARTRKRSSPDKRGRFNLGEKQVLALCREARIVTTKGTAVGRVEVRAEPRGIRVGASCDGFAPTLQAVFGLRELHAPRRGR